MLPTSPFKVAGPATTFALVDGTASTERTRRTCLRAGGALVYRVVSAHSAGGRPGELGRLGRQAWQAQVAIVPYSVTGLDDRRGSVTRVVLVRRLPLVGKGGDVLTYPTRASGPTRFASRPQRS